MTQTTTAISVTGQSGQSGTGTGLNKTPSPADMATSQAAFDNANRTGDVPVATETPSSTDNQPLGPEQAPPVTTPCS